MKRGGNWVAVLSWLACACSDSSNEGPADGGADAGTPSPILLERLPLELSKIDFGQVLAERAKYEGGYPIADFGYVHPSKNKPNPQPVLHAPLGTKVLAPV